FLSHQLSAIIASCRDPLRTTFMEFMYARPHWCKLLKALLQTRGEFIFCIYPTVQVLENWGNYEAGSYC
ncbi:hypothetical protein MJO28_017666, partial [Puccinia striiformis f. sp. tritici]